MNQNSRISSIALSATVALWVGAAFAPGSAGATSHYYYGGGSSFAAPVYVGPGYLSTHPEARLSTNTGLNNAGAGFNQSGITSGSAFDALKTHSGYDYAFSYCQTGSGFGKDSLNGSSSARASNKCRDYRTNPLGLSSEESLNQLDFIGTEAPYSTADYNAFLSGPMVTQTGITQVPILAGAIALPHGDTIDNVALTSAQVCKIYSGVIYKWGQIAGVTGTGNKALITMIYRTDRSGTTFALTSYLARTCNGTGNVPAGFVFTPNENFGDAIPGGVALYGTRAVGASGNPGEVGATLNRANKNALGYADAGEVVLEAAGYATVNGYDPTQFGAAGPITLPSSSLLRGKVLDGATINEVPGTASQTVKDCMFLVDPNLKLANTYPIFAISYLASYYTPHIADGRLYGLRLFYGSFYNKLIHPTPPLGFAYLDRNGLVAAKFRSTIESCIN